ncbi:DUF4157 domain-containing protein [Flavobacterium fluviatile]|uniref:eCIS core domain-containing protein n=1 Tax=Flavobacterium fluviatile TaxID=1862387 RepID=UPI0013D4567D|nr:DUF4157 domain-containing protein [Flavobacterium fluviatile]
MREFEQKKIAKQSPSPFFGPKIQKKIKTGTAGDKYEAEADNVADKVVNRNSSASGLLQSKEDIKQKPVSETISSVQSKEMKEEKSVQKKGKEEEKPVQKKSDKKEEEKPVQKKGTEEEKPVQKKSGKKEEEKTVQKKCDNCEKEDQVQKKENKEEEKSVQKKGQNEIQNNDLEEKLNNSKGSGASLDESTKNEMESGFGNDFSNVKIHTGTNAIEMSQELGAQAFTNGNDVYFNEGKYNPRSKEGKHLLAHELTHTIQQGNRSKNIQKQSNVLQLATIPWKINQWTTHKRISNNFSVGSGGTIALSSNLAWAGPPRCSKITNEIEVKIYRSAAYWFDSKVHSDTISLSGGSTSVSDLSSGTYYVEIYLGGYNGDPTHCSLTGEIAIATS